MTFQIHFQCSEAGNAPILVTSASLATCANLSQPGVWDVWWLLSVYFATSIISSCDHVARLKEVFHLGPWAVQVLGARRSHCWHGSNLLQAPQTQAQSSQERWCRVIDWERRKKISCRPWPHFESKPEASLLLELTVVQLLGTSTKKRACLTISKKVS